MLFFHNNSFKGQEKELVVINELLEEILLPYTDNTYSISEILKEEIGEEEVWIGVYKGDFVDRVYVNCGNTEKYGFINIRNFASNTVGATFPTEHSLQVLNRVSFLLRERFPNYLNTEELKKWLKEISGGVSERGIEKRLTEIDFHQEVAPEIIIPFVNRYADKNIFNEEFKKLFKTTITEQVSDEVILKSIEGTFENYLKNVNEKLDIKIGTDGDGLEALKQLYYSPRKKPDTDKAIFRLSSIGIIDDYTVDYNKNCYKIRTLKKTDGEYIEYLKVFMRKYYSANRVESEIDNVNLTFKELSGNIEKYKTEIIKNANDSEEVAKILNVIIEDLYLEFHNDWLKKFNQKYLLEYDRLQYTFRPFRTSKKP